MKTIALPPGAREARDEAAAERIGDEREDYGDAARLLQQGLSRGRAVRKNDIGLQRNRVEYHRYVTLNNKALIVTALF